MIGGAPLRIAILAHSTNPRGGVVHALELGDALTRLGHAPVVHAPDSSGGGFFRATLCGTVAIEASPAGIDTAQMVELRVTEYVRHFERAQHRRFDIFHAQDGISGNALATLKERGVIDAYARTVHHVDCFRDERLSALQARSIVAADKIFVVSRLWQDHLRETLGKVAVLVGNGVDRTRFSPEADGSEEKLRRRLGIAGGPIFLAIGGVEERKNTIRVLEAFIILRTTHLEARLLIAGGASLLDHHAYQRRFSQLLAASGLPDGSVIVTGPLDQADMPALYRIADSLVVASLKEGFGLVVLEAMASGRPVVAAKIAPFTEYLGAEDAAWCNPESVASLAHSMAMTVSEAPRRRLIAQGLKVSLRHDWRHVALAHLPVYASMREHADA